MKYTPQEAIDNIDEVLNSTVYYDESLEYEISSYDFDWLETAKSALEKQIPKKPKNYLVNMKHIDFLCPNCKKRIISKVDGEWVAGKNQKFCDNCGQALDWSDI